MLVPEDLHHLLVPVDLHFLFVPEDLQFLLVPDRLEASLGALDTSKDGELDIDECIVAASES